jgi:hypothetical protein
MFTERTMRHFFKIIPIFLLIFSACGSKNTASGPANSNPAVQLILTPFSGSIIAGACSGVNVVQAQDINGNPDPVSQDQRINLIPPTGSTTMTFYSDVNCSKKVTSVIMPSGTTSINFYLKDSVAEITSLTVASQNIEANTQSYTIISADAAQLALVGPNNIAAGLCSPAYNVTAENVSGVASNVSNNVVIQLTGNGTGHFYTTPDCSTGAITSVTIPSGSQSTAFYYMGSKEANLNFLAQTTGNVIAELPVSVLSGAATQLAFLTFPQQFPVGSCSSVYKVEAQDAFGNAAFVSQNTPITLSGTNLNYYSDSACAVPVPANIVTMASGTNTVSFYVSTTTVLSSSVKVSGLGSQTQSLNILAGNPAQLAWLQEPQSTMVAGQGLLQFQTLVNDQFGNLVLLGIKPGDGGIATSLTFTAAAYADSACTIPAAQTLNGLNTVAPREGIGLFTGGSYNKAQTIYIGVTLGTLPQICSTPIQITADVPSSFLFSGPNSAQAGVCSGLITLTSFDRFGNTALASSDSFLSVTGLGSSLMYPTADCSGSAETSVPFIHNTSTAQFSLKDSKIETLTLIESGIGGTQARDVFTITPGNPTQIVFSGPTTVQAGQCTAGFIAKLEDTFGNSTTSATDIPVTLASTAAGNFYLDSSCVTSTTSFAISAGTSVRNLYYLDSSVETVNLTITGLSLTSNDQFSVVSAAPTQLSIVAPTTAVAGTTFSPIQVELKDQFGNLTTTQSKSIFLAVYSDPTCSTFSTSSATGTTLINSTNGVATFSDIKYFKAQQIYLGVTSQGITSACSPLVTVAPAIASKIGIVSSNLTNAIKAGTCSLALTVDVTDAFANPVGVTANTILGLTGNSNGNFYIDSGCTSVASSVTIPNGQSSIPFYFEDNKSESLFFTANNAILGSANASLSINPATPNTLIMNGPSVATVGVCTVFSLNSQDSFGNNSSVSADTIISLAGGNGSFYSDSNCNSAISSVKIISGTNTAQFSFKDNTAEAIDLLASSNGLSSAINPLILNALGPSKIVLVSSAVSSLAGQCTSAFKIQSEDSLNNISNVTSNLLVNFSGIGNGSFYSDSSCTTLISGSTIGIGNSSATFYFKDQTAENLILNIGTLLGNLSTNLTVNNNIPAQLVFSTVPKTVIAGQCSGSVVVQSQDQFGNPAIVSTVSTVNLTGTGVSFFTTSNCSGIAITSIPIAVGTNASTFFVTSQSTASNQLTASGLSSVNQALIISPANESKLGFGVAPGVTLMAGQLFSPSVTVLTKDQFGNLVPTGTDQITVAAYTDNQCQTLAPTNLIGTLIRNATAGTATFADISSSVTETIYIGAVTNTGLTPVCSNLVNITPPAASKIVIASTQSSVNAGTCSAAINIETEDPFNNLSNVSSNLVVGLTGMGTGTFYANSNCTGSVTSVTIASGTNTKTVYLKDNVSENLIFATTNTASLTNGTFPYTVAPGAPVEIVIGGANSTPAGVCSSVMTVGAGDSLGNLSPVSTNTSITIASSSGTGIFYLDSACTTPVSGTSVTIPSGDKSDNLYFLDAVKENITLTYSGLGSPVVESFSVLAPPPSNLAVTGSSALIAGSCSSAITVNTTNSGGTVFSLYTSTTISVAGLSNGLIYTDPGCTVAHVLSGGSFVMAAGTSTQTIYLKDNVAESLSLGFSGTGLSVAIFNVGVTAGPISQITFQAQPPASTVSNGILSTITAYYADSLGNIINNALPITVSLQLSGGGAGPAITTGTTTQTPDGTTGIATFTGLAIQKAGSYKMVASGVGFTGLSNIFIISGGPASVIAINAGNNQDLPRSKIIPNPMEVLVTDSSGNPASATVTYTVSLASKGSLSATPGVKSQTQVSSVSTGLADAFYTASTSLESAVITATIPTGTVTSVTFNEAVVSMAPLTNVISAPGSILEFATTGAPISLSESGTPVTSTVALLSPTTSAAAKTGSGIAPTLSATPVTAIVTATSITNGTDSIAINDVVTLPSGVGVTSASCALSPSTVPAIASLFCSIGSPAVTPTRNEINAAGNITSQAVSNSAGPLDFLNSNNLATDLYTIKQFSNIDSGNNDNPSNLTAFNGDLYFTANNSSNGVNKLFQTNGTTITQISNISGLSTNDNISNLSPVGTAYLYFNANNSSGVQKVFRYDTALGSIIQTSDSSGGESVADSATDFQTDGTNLYYSATNSSSGVFTKMFEATSSGLIQVSNFQGTGASDLIPTQGGIAFYDGLIYLSAQDTVSTSHLFKLSGTIYSAISNISGGSFDNVQKMMVMGSDLFLVANNSSGKTKLYKYNDTAGVITQVSNINGNTANDVVFPAGFCNGKSFFVVGQGIILKLYQYDGTNFTQISNVAGSLNTDNNGTNLGACYNNKYYIPLSDINGHDKLYKYDGTNLSQVSNLNPLGADQVGSMAVYNNYLYFGATNSTSKMYRLCDSAAGCTP